MVLVRKLPFCILIAIGDSAKFFSSLAVTAKVSNHVMFLAFNDGANA
jgi:hypothetical protein